MYVLLNQKALVGEGGATFNVLQNMYLKKGPCFEKWMAGVHIMQKYITKLSEMFTRGRLEECERKIILKPNEVRLEIFLENINRALKFAEKVEFNG